MQPKPKFSTSSRLLITGGVLSALFAGYVLIEESNREARLDAEKLRLQQDLDSVNRNARQQLDEFGGVIYPKIDTIIIKRGR